MLGALLDIQGHAVVEPVGECASYDEELLEQASDTASSGWWAVLTDKHWGNGAHASDAETGNDTSAVDLANRV